MKYASSASFRRALEDRLQAHSQKTALPLIRLRKLVAFDRLLARLTMEQSATWVLKGGLALQLRLGPQARTTQDVDLVMSRLLKPKGSRLTKSGLPIISTHRRYWNVAVCHFIEPVLRAEKISQWNPQRWEWQTQS